MDEAFETLTSQEREFLHKAPLLVCILIAGADGVIDRKEIRKAIQIAEENNKKTNSVLANYFREVSNDFEDKLKIIIQSYPYDLAQRNSMISEELGIINQLWSKLSLVIAESLYHILLDLAEKIASSSGGWLGIKSISVEESRLIKLPMISDPRKI